MGVIEDRVVLFPSGRTGVERIREQGGVVREPFTGLPRPAPVNRLPIRRTRRVGSGRLPRQRRRCPTTTTRQACSHLTREGRPVLATGGHDGVLRLWEPETGGLVHALPVGAPINALLTMDSLLVIGPRDGLIALDS